MTSWLKRLFRPQDEIQKQAVETAAQSMQREVNERIHGMILQTMTKDIMDYESAKKKVLKKIQDDIEHKKMSGTPVLCVWCRKPGGTLHRREDGNYEHEVCRK